METWVFIWKAFFLITLALFSVMAVWVSIGGFRDLKILFRKMEEANRHPQEEEE